MELVTRLPARGEVEEALTPEEFCRMYAADISRFAGIVAAGMEAEDIAQDALIKALRRLDSFDPQRGSMTAWLWRIVVNTARDSERRSSRRFALARRLVPGPESVASIEDDVIQRLNTQELLAAVQQLTQRDRELIALRFGADLDTASVGDLVGLSAESARRAIGRALARLRTVIQGGGRDVGI